MNRALNKITQLIIITQGDGRNNQHMARSSSSQSSEWQIGAVERRQSTREPKEKGGESVKETGAKSRSEMGLQPVKRGNSKPPHGRLK